ncbi:diguanylate cyclase [Pseudoroseicyclus sp. CXY001]|uniref:GGDEF domain-containing protein n=1 Tax=Pseudoroseicyclus sp. CXY001 TaxID=3242492 RepID=UPI00358DA385
MRAVSQLSAQSIGEFRKAVAISRGLEHLAPDFAMLAIALALVALAGHASAEPGLYLATLGGLSPLTAIIALLIGAAAFSSASRLGAGQLRRVFAWGAMLVLACSGMRLVGSGGMLPDPLWQEPPGPNSIMLLLLAALSLLGRRRSVIALGMGLGGLALILSLVLSYGHAAGGLHGTEPATMLIAALLLTAALCRQGHPAVLRLMISEGTTGKVLRRQLLYSLAGLWLLAVVLLHIDASAWAEAAPLFVTMLAVAAVLGIGSTIGLLAAAENARQRHLIRLEQLSATDMLTGLANRRAASAYAEATFHAARRHGRPLAILMIDLDHFKRINDRHGHKIGDEILAEAAHLFRSILRPSDMISRWGGEEFLAILPETQLAGAVKTAERLRQSLEDSLVLPGGSFVTASFGCAEMAPGDMDLDDLLGRADAALYEAKDQGRNSVAPMLPPRLQSDAASFDSAVA